jgi:hypothetical protein
MAIKPTDAPWFVPYEPESATYDRLLELADAADSITEENMDAEVERITGHPMEDMMEASVHEAIVVIAATGGNLPLDAVGVGAWMTGFGSGLRKRRNIKLPENPPDDPMEMVRLIFDDLDVEAVTFVAAERVSTALSRIEDLPTDTDPRLKVLTVTASLWLDGLMFGLRFDVEGAK